MIATAKNGSAAIGFSFDAAEPGMPLFVYFWKCGKSGSRSCYWVELLPSQFGTALRFRKALDRADDDPENYDVLLTGENYGCECKGFLRHGHCKHGLAAREIVASGALRPSPRPEQACEVPAKRSEEDRLWSRLEEIDPITARILRCATSRVSDGELQRTVAAAECRLSNPTDEFGDP